MTARDRLLFFVARWLLGFLIRSLGGRDPMVAQLSEMIGEAEAEARETP